MPPTPRRRPPHRRRLRLLAGRLRRRHLHLRLRPVLRVDRQPQAAATRRRHQPDGEQGRLLAGGVRRRRLRLRRCRLLRVDTRRRAVARRVGPARTASTRPSSAWCPRRTVAATSWWPPTAASSPSATPGSRARARASAAAREPRCAVVPDATGNGYWLITQTGNVYAFGDAPFYGAPGQPGLPGHLGRAHRRRARVLGPARRRRRVRLRGRGGTRRPGGLGRGLRPGLGHLRRRRRRGILGRLGRGCGVLLRRRARTTDPWLGTTSTAPSSPPPASDGRADAGDARREAPVDGLRTCRTPSGAGGGAKEAMQPCSATTPGASGWRCVGRLVAGTVAAGPWSSSLWSAGPSCGGRRSAGRGRRRAAPASDAMPGTVVVVVVVVGGTTVVVVVVGGTVVVVGGRGAVVVVWCSTHDALPAAGRRCADGHRRTGAGVLEGGHVLDELRQVLVLRRLVRRQRQPRPGQRPSLRRRAVARSP